MTRFSLLFTALLALVLVILGVGDADVLAATVTDGGGLITVADNASETNVITLTQVGGSVEIRDFGALLVNSAASCSITGTTPADTVVTCPVSTPVTADGGNGNDSISVTPDSTFVAVLNGGAGSDTLTGGAGNDSLDGNAGGDSLYGNGGADLFADTGGAGDVDIVSYNDAAHATTGVIVTTDGVRDEGADGVDGTSGVTLGRGNDRIFTSIEWIEGSPVADTMTGGDAVDTFLGLGGNDTLTGGGAADLLNGGRGADTINAQDGIADTFIGCDADGGPNDSGDVANVDVADAPRNDCETINLPSGGGGGGGGGGGSGDGGGGTSTGGGGGASGPSSKPVNTDLPQIVSTTGGTGPFRLNADLSCNPGDWTPGGYSIAGYAWFRYASVTSAPVKIADGQDYTVKPADQGTILACASTARNAAGSTATLSPRATVVQRVKIPAKIRRMSLEKAKSYLRTLFDGNVSFGADGASLKAIPCDFGGDQPDRDGCTAADPIEPGQVFNSTPPIGHFIDEAYGANKLPKIVLDYYDPAKDRGDDVPKATPKVDCPVTMGKDIRQDFENRILGHYAQYARDLLAKYNCPFSESTKLVADQSIDPYVTEVQAATIKGDQGYKLFVSAPKVPDLAAAVFHRRLSGRDSFQGANLSRGPVNPGLGDDGKLTVTLGGQKNDICFTVTETSTGRVVPNALITAYDPSGNDVADLLGRKDVVRTGDDGVGCGTFSIREKGWYRFVYTYYGANGTNAEGSQRIEAIDRGRTVWTTIDGRSMQCKGECEQLGFASSRRAHAANVLDDIGNLFHGILDALSHIGSSRVDPAAARKAAQSDGSPSATLYTAQESNGVAPSVFVLKGDLKTAVGVPIVSTSGSGLITNDGGSLVAVKIADLITNDGGSLIAVAFAKAGEPVAKNAKILLITKDGRIISNDGASLITNDGGSLITNDGGSLTAQAAGSVVMVGNRAVIADASGRLAPGTLVSLGSGGALPVSRVVSDNGLG